MTINKAISTIKVAVAEVDWNYPLDYAIAFETAIEVLREKLEREKGCEHCNKEKNSDINVDGRRIGQAYLHECSNGYAMFLYLCGNTETYYVDAEYCPHCGRKLGGENV